MTRPTMMRVGSWLKAGGALIALARFSAPNRYRRSSFKVMSSPSSTIAAQCHAHGRSSGRRRVGQPVPAMSERSDIFEWTHQFAGLIGGLIGLIDPQKAEDDFLALFAR